MFERLKAIVSRFEELERKLADPAVLSAREQVQQYSKELAGLTPLVHLYRKHERLQEHLRQAQAMAAKPGDAEMKALAVEEVAQLQRALSQTSRALEERLLAGGGDANRPVIVEIRAGTGGQEASLFVGDLFRMYSKYAARCGLKIETMDSHTTESGGFKEIIFSASGPGAWQQFKFESGTHRVQRVPATEAQGRIHTSAVTVAVLPEAEEVEVEIHPKDLEIDVYRSSGPGGQSVNTADSAVRITHRPTGLVVTCQDERSQLKNKQKALRVLRARLLDRFQAEQRDKISSDRKSQVGSGDRSEKIRTYNFPDHRVTDHRVGLTIHRLEEIMDGDLGEIIAALAGAEKQQRLSAA
ncbi:MAG: peptide chain release factor 1 [Candidatus Omnitrophica bacterium]|nr:peptide chain release factor 1 [Candidatus Omnitrophota bacterium]